MRFKEKLVRFMMGRYGTDQLNSFILVAVMIVILINVFVNSFVLTLVYLLLWGWSLFRSMSRNIYKRRLENETFLKLFKPVKNQFNLMKNKHRDRNTHVYRKCPKCKAVLRLPKKKGEHTVRCPKCGERFEVKI